MSSPYRNQSAERETIREARAALTANKTIAPDDLTAYIRQTGVLAVAVAMLLATVERLQDVADYYEQRDARPDQAAAEIKGGAR